MVVIVITVIIPIMRIYKYNQIVNNHDANNVHIL